MAECAITGTSVDVPTSDGAADAWFVHPADGAPHPAVLLYMDAFGLRPHLRSMADRLAGAGYAVLVPNVFHRHGRAPVVELPDHIAGDGRAALFGRIRPMMGGLTPEVVASDADAYLTWLQARPETEDRAVGVTGYCMGARLALLTAGSHPKRVAAAAGFHGAGLATPDADSPHLLAPGITAELYFGHADNDSANPPEAQATLDQALTAAGVRHRAEVYTGASHGFTMADTDAYDERAADRHWSALLGLFARTL
ncbi:dienelactone hydrolase family protein [Streptomyces sp. NBC_00102]|uniref:dienelactone hydrolase family protein n=1 Tax=Streptomyces sp. NBC_00102 TaxID=2975652 RepID=UPI0022593633|nr:dienelactone hydrolase family protein [Streptomyces sp. NBC_00102]MCX5395550.1 dienelactone hydrolase family protein [Streptomyces sp. NBC_00102]